MTRTVKISALILSILVVIAGLPMTVFGAEFNEWLEAASLKTNTEAEVIDLCKDIYELKDKRTATTKHFRLEDGSFYVAQYNTDIHYLDENGEYQDIDNSLSASGSEISTSNAKIKFAKKTTGNNNIFTLHDGNRKLTLSLDDANKKIEGKIFNNETEFGDDTTQLQKMTTLDKISASVLYEDILANTDLEYVINGLNIKENIIVKDKADNYAYSFTMQLNNLTAELSEKGSIYISDTSTHEVVYTIPAPVMWDAEYIRSNDVSMALDSHGNGKYTLTVTADSEWMNASDRVYPITIDPPIYVNSSASSITDLDVSTNSPNYSSPGDETIYVSSIWRMFWKNTSLPDLPVGAYITEAEFTLQCVTDTTLEGYVAVYDVLTDWDETLTWNKVISTTPQGQPSTHFVDYEPISTNDPDGSGILYPNSIDGYTFNITPLVKKWYNGQNYGLMIAPATNTTFTGVAIFQSNDSTSTSLRPQLCIKYVDMKGIEDYWSFTSQSAGFAGSGAVNNATGNLVFSIPTLTTTDALMPITPSLIYNFEIDSGYYQYPTVQTANSTAFTPKGFKLNINETLIKKSFTDTDGNTVYYIIWADDDGTEHYFMPTGSENEDGEIEYKDEDGLMLTLLESTASCTITDMNDTVRTFVSRGVPSSDVISAWQLTSISDNTGNEVVFGFDSLNRPITVSLVPYLRSAIVQLRISYNSAGVPYAVWNPASGEGVVFRYSDTYAGSIGTAYGSYLRRIIRAHGVTTESAWLAFYNSNSNVSTSTITVDGVAEYSYNSNGLLTTVINTLSKYQLIYEIDASQKITYVTEYSTATSTTGQKIGFTYSTSSTEIRTSGKDDIYATADDLTTTYGFDNCGRTVSCYTTDLDKTQIYGASSGQYVGGENENAKNNLKSSVQTTQQSSNYLLNGGFEMIASSGIPYWTTTGRVNTLEFLPYGGHACADFELNSSITSSSIYQYVDLPEGDYSLSLYIRSVCSDSLTVYMKAESITDSTHSVIQQVPVNEYFAADMYAFSSINFSASPSTSGRTEHFKITILVTGSMSGDEEICIDNVMLSRTTGSSEFDMVQAGHFETSNGYYPNSFWNIYDDSTESITVVNSGINAFGNVLCIDKNINEVIFPQQVVYEATDEMKTQYLDGNDPDGDPILFTVSGWGKGTCQSYSDFSNFSIWVEVKYYDGTTYGTTENHFFLFDKGITDWQFTSGGFATDPDKGIIDTIIIRIMYTEHSGIGYFDNISLVRDSYTTKIYDYNSLGYITSYQSGSQTSWYSYDTEDEYNPDKVKRIVHSDGTIIDYDYYNSGNIRTEDYRKYTEPVPDTGIVIESNIEDQYCTLYTYNDYGQPTATVVFDVSESEGEIHSSTEYNTANGSHIFGTVSSETDSLGKVTRYFYNENNGRLLATIYPDGNGVSYSYDGVGNLIQVLPATFSSSSNTYSSNTLSASVEYTYDNVTKRLSTIKTKSSTYNFTYDGFGNTAQIGVGTRTLASYTYNSNNGKLNTLTYGNGDKVKYYYDVLDRVEEIWYNNGSGSDYIAYSYKYDTAGSLSSVTDHINNETTVYRYDASGKLMQSYVFDSETYKNLYGTRVYYDSQSRVSQINHTLDYSASTGMYGDTTKYLYTYNDITGYLGLMSVYSDYLSGNISPQYDNFGRVSTKTSTFNVNNASAFYNKLTFDYVTNNEKESVLVSQVISQVGKTSSSTTSTTYNYTYDNNGNITKITNANGATQNKYYYDALGQLIREDNLALNATYTYSYDNAGNITSKKRYAYTIGTVGTVLETFSYTYGNSTWGDLLTKYNGETITYDTIGNPTSIDYVELQWQGRELTEYYDGDFVYVNFGYNSEGIRTYKAYSNGNDMYNTRTEYLLNGSQIIGEIYSYEDYAGDYNNRTIIYIYDESGSLIGLKYRTSTYAEGVFNCYFFEKNLQGDIVAIYNSNGTKIGTYTYDAWGNFTITSSATGLERQIVYEINPFRYRSYYYDVETGCY